MWQNLINGLAPENKWLFFDVQTTEFRLQIQRTNLRFNQTIRMQVATASLQNSIDLDSVKFLSLLPTSNVYVVKLEKSNFIENAKVALYFIRFPFDKNWRCQVKVDAWILTNSIVYGYALLDSLAVGGLLAISLRAFSGSINFGLVACTGIIEYRVVSFAGAGVFEKIEVNGIIRTIDLIITSPRPYQVFQRQLNGTATINITGTYSGGDSLVARWKEGQWQALTIDAGGLNGSVNGQIGQGNLEIAIDSTLQVLTTIPYVSVGINVLLIGQSNVSGRGVNHQSYLPSTLKVGLFANDDNWKECLDPTDLAVNQVDAVSTDSSAAGSPWPLLAKYFLAKDIPCGFIPAAKGGTSITQWLPASSHTDSSTLYGSAVRRAQLAGGCEIIIWWQGETDAINAMSATTYAGHLQQIASSLFVDVSGGTFFAAILQNCTGINDTPEQEIRTGTIQSINDNAYVYAGADLSDILTDDDFHLQSDVKLAEAAKRWWLAIGDELNLHSDFTGSITLSLLVAGEIQGNPVPSITGVASYSGITVSATIITTQQSPLLSGLGMYWRLDEIDGIRADSHGNHHLTPFGGITGIAGKVNNAANFTGNSNGTFLVADYSPEMEIILAEDFTVALWVKPNSDVYNLTFIEKWKHDQTTNLGEWYLATKAARTLYFYAYEDDLTLKIFQDNNAYKTLNGQWSFVVLQYDFTNYQFKLGINNGVMATLQLSKPRLTGTGTPIVMGKYRDGLTVEMNGLIDEVGIWSRLLTGNELTELYNNNIGLTYPF